MIKLNNYNPVVFAILIAPISVGVVWLAFWFIVAPDERMYRYTHIAIIYSYFISFIFGLPIHYILNKFNFVSLKFYMFFGFIIPLLLFVIPAVSSLGFDSLEKDYLILCALFVMSGSVVGAVFYLIMYKSDLAKEPRL